MRKKINGIIAVFLILNMLLGFVPVFRSSVHAATTSGISVVSYRYNGSSNKYELTVTWNGLRTTKSLQVQYNTPEAPGSATQVLSATEVGSVNTSISKFTAVIDASNFNDDIIYTLKFTMYDGASGSGSVTSSGILYFMTKISFYASREEQIFPAGVYETGTKPELKLRWNIPQIWDDGASAFVDANTALGQIKTSLGLADDITALNYRINISTKAQALDSGPDINPVMVEDDGSGVYEASAMGKDVEVNLGVSGEMSFNLLGRRDSADTSLDGVITGKLPHKEILPGTVYFMNIKPVFVSSGGDAASVVTIGDPSKYNGSMVTDEDSNLAYTFTPIRFQLSRDVSDNIYVKVYRINKDDGSLDMPNLYYSIQAIDTPGVSYGHDWPEKAKMTDEFFPSGSEYAITVISGVNPGTTMYYKVVVKTESKNDRIESLKLKYQMALDNSKPPVPIDIKVDHSRSELVSGTVIDEETGATMVDENGNEVIVKSTNIVLTWLKPQSWDAMTSNEKEELNFHVLLGRNAVNLDVKKPISVNGVEREYLVNYRWVKTVNGSELTESSDGKRLEYKLDGLELFELSDTERIKNPDKYPTYLMENTIYYLKIFTTKGLPAGGFGGISDNVSNGISDGILDDTDVRAVMNTDDVSDKSVTASFTTLPVTEKEVPVATGFKALAVDMHKVTLQFSKVNIDWTNYTNVLDGNNKELYDLYMSTSSSAAATYVKIGSTDGSEVPSGVGVDNVEFLLVNGKMQIVVSGLKANTTYYFKLQTRLDFSDPALDDRVSAFTAVVPVTTPRDDVQDPDEATRKPIAPVDFNIAKDEEGNLEITGSSVAFDWSRSENDVNYRLIVTSERISEDAEEADYANDPYYISFINKFNEITLSLDPDSPSGTFSFDALKEICKYRVQEWMVPNSLYYFSLRAERKTTRVASAWVTIPVTTSLIDEPENLQVVSDVQLGIQWTDDDLTVKAEDYNIYIRKAGESTYTQLGINQGTVVKDTEAQQGAGQFYGRIRGLDANTEYYVRVYKGQSAGDITYKDIGALTTRDDYHQIEVRWKGLPAYTYEMALKTEAANDYTTLENGNFDLIKEKSTDTLGTSYYMYYARIKAVPSTLADGSTTTLPLKSNTKYYIKVRAILENLQPSKYAGPVTARTQFNQDDYDDNEDIEDTKTKFIDRIGDLEKKLYWRVDMSDSDINKLLLKGDRVDNALRNNGGNTLTIDISPKSASLARDIIYIPSVIINTLNSEKDSLTLKTTGAEYTIRPGMLELENMQEIDELEEQDPVREIFLKITITRSKYGAEKLTTEVKPVTDINDFELVGIGSTKTDEELKKDFYNKVYNAETGLVKQTLDQITSTYDVDASQVLLEGDYYIDYLVNQVEFNLSKHIENTIEGGDGITGMVNSSEYIKEFSGPLSVKMTYSDTQASFKTPYAMFDDSYTWQKLALNTADEANGTIFRVLKTGKYMITTAKDFAVDVPSDHWAKESIYSLASKYELSDVFGNTASFSPDSSISIKEVILLYEKIAGKAAENAGSDLKQKAKKLGLDGIINASAATRDLSRQEAASVMVRLYCLKEGLSSDRILAKGNVNIKDGREIADKHYSNVLAAVDFGIFSLDDNGNFLPGNHITRAEIITAIVRVLKLTGDM